MSSIDTVTSAANLTVDCFCDCRQQMAWYLRCLVLSPCFYRPLNYVVFFPCILLIHQFVYICCMYGGKGMCSLIQYAEYFQVYNVTISVTVFVHLYETC